MKLKVILLIILSLLCYNSIFAQRCRLTAEEKQQIIDSLYSIDSDVRWNSLEYISECDIIEATNALEETFWSLSPTTVLRVLYEFESDKTYQYALAYYDTIEIQINHPDNDEGWEKELLLDEQVSTVEIMFRYNDFSKAGKVIELLDYYPEHPKNSAAMSALEYLINNVPQYSERARNELLTAVRSTAYDGWERLKFLYTLHELYKDETFPIAKDMFINNTDFVARMMLLGFLRVYENEDILGFIKERFLVEQDTAVFHYMLETLQKAYCSPSTYKFLMEASQTISNPSFSDDIKLDLRIFEAFDPDTMIKNMNIMLDTLRSYNNQCRMYNWIDNNFASEINSKIENAKFYLNSGDSINCAKQIKFIKEQAAFEYSDSLSSTPGFITKEGWQFLYFYSTYILNRLPEIPEGLNHNIKLFNSQGTLLTGGTLQYYEGSWKEGINNGDGTFLVNTTQPRVSLRMTYEGGSQTLSNVSLADSVAVFRTVNALVQLQNSAGNPIDTGRVQYYAGSWREFGYTSEGTVAKELLPANYSFRMSYAFASNDKQQNIGTNPTVVFQTVNAAIELRNSTGNLIDQGSVQYYSGAWRNIGTTSNGVVNVELLPNNYSFRMSYAYASNDKQQNIGTNPTVVFQTVNAAIELRNSTGTLIDQGTVQYYSGSWRNIGTTSNGVVNVELLPNNYSFRMSYAFVSNDKQQNIGTNPTVTFSTVLCTVRVTQQGQPVNNADIKYYSGAWRQFGLTSNGEVTKELLPANLTFRAAYSGTSQDKTQNITANNIVEFVLP